MTELPSNLQPQAQQPQEIKIEDVVLGMRNTVIDITLPPDQSRKLLLEGINLMVKKINEMGEALEAADKEESTEDDK